MSTVHKWNVPLDDAFSLYLPKGAKILCVQEQNDFPKLWAMVDPGQELEERNFITYGTGHEMRNTVHVYVGTYQLHQGALVFHVFEVAPSSGEAA